MTINIHGAKPGQNTPNEKALSARNTKGFNNHTTNGLNFATGCTRGKAQPEINATPHQPGHATISPGAEYTTKLACNLHDSEIFSRPEFSKWVIPTSYGFGRDGLVRKAGRTTNFVYSTSRPPDHRLNNGDLVFQSQLGAETMTNVIPMVRTRAAESTQSTTSSLDICRQQAAIKNALDMAAYYMRLPRTPETLHAAIGKTSRAMTLLKTACADSQIGGA